MKNQKLIFIHSIYDAHYCTDGTLISTHTHPYVVEQLLERFRCGDIRVLIMTRQFLIGWRLEMDPPPEVEFYRGGWSAGEIAQGNARIIPLVTSLSTGE